MVIGASLELGVWMLALLGYLVFLQILLLPFGARNLPAPVWLERSHKKPFAGDLPRGNFVEEKMFQGFAADGGARCDARDDGFGALAIGAGGAEDKTFPDGRMGLQGTLDAVGSDLPSGNVNLVASAPAQMDRGLHFHRYPGTSY